MGTTSPYVQSLELPEAVFMNGIKIANTYSVYEYAFAYRKEKEITIPLALRYLSEYIFWSTDLNTINYKGNTSQWDSITKEELWRYGSAEHITIHCTDKDL